MGSYFLRRKEKEIATAYKQSKIVRNENKIGRNDACPCGSGKKYKKCCGNNTQRIEAARNSSGLNLVYE